MKGLARATRTYSLYGHLHRNNRPSALSCSLRLLSRFPQGMGRAIHTNLTAKFKCDGETQTDGPAGCHFLTPPLQLRHAVPLSYLHAPSNVTFAVLWLTRRPARPRRHAVGLHPTPCLRPARTPHLRPPFVPLAVLKLAMIKTERLARKLFSGNLYDCVCVFDTAEEGPGPGVGGQAVAGPTSAGAGSAGAEAGAGIGSGANARPAAGVGTATALPGQAAAAEAKGGEASGEGGGTGG